MRALMYHYVRPSVDRPPHGYYHLDLRNFRRQLDYVESELSPLDRESFVGCVTGDRSPSEDAVLLTFDDGLLDHYEWVFPELEARGLFGVFFVPTSPLTRRSVLPVHRVHALVGRHSVDELHEAMVDVLKGYDFSDSNGPLPDYPSDNRRTDDVLRSFKRTLNFEVPHDEVDGVLTEIESRFDGPPSVDEYYLTGSNLREMSDAGMIVAPHTVNHPVLSHISPAEQREEIVRSVEALTETIGELRPNLFAYPFGGERTFTAGTIRHLREVECDAAFTTVSAPVTPERLRNSPLSLPRVDCNELPHGDATFDIYT